MQVWNTSPSLELVTMLGRSACAPTSLPFQSESQSECARREEKKNGVLLYGRGRDAAFGEFLRGFLPPASESSPASLPRWTPPRRWNLDLGPSQSGYDLCFRCSLPQRPSDCTHARC